MASRIVSGSILTTVPITGQGAGDLPQHFGLAAAVRYCFTRKIPTGRAPARLSF
jgi:hypothetical protein